MGSPDLPRPQTVSQSDLAGSPSLHRVQLMLDKYLYQLTYLLTYLLILCRLDHLLAQLFAWKKLYEGGREGARPDLPPPSSPLKFDCMTLQSSMAPC